MKIVCLKGGLGNQMFEYCRFRDLMESGHDEVYLFYDHRRLKQHNGLRLSDCFELELPSCPWGVKLVVWGLKICRAVGVLKRLYDDEKPEAVLIDDYSQHRRFIPNARRYFFFRQFLAELQSGFVQMIRAVDYPVSVHVRRGDYLHPSNSSFGLCGVDYFQQAIAYVRKKRPDARFFFFSDDMEWVRENLWMEDAVYVEHTELLPDYVDLYLMTLCRGHIISNSTFSFWGAYLAVDGNGMKIYPRRWFRDPTWTSSPIFSEEWVGL